MPTTSQGVTSELDILTGTHRQLRPPIRLRIREVLRIIPRRSRD